MQKAAKLIASGALVGELNAEKTHFKHGHHLGERFYADHDPYVTYHPVKKIVHKAVPVIKHHGHGHGHHAVHHPLVHHDVHHPVVHDLHHDVHHPLVHDLHHDVHHDKHHDVHHDAHHTVHHPLVHHAEPLYHAPLVVAPEPVYKVVHRPLRYVARPARVYKRPSYKHVHHVHHHHVPVKHLDLTPKTHYVADFHHHDPKCDHECIEKKADQVLKSLEAEVEKDKETCLAAAEALRKQMVDEAAALRTAQVHDVAHQVDDSIKALEKLKAESVAMLRPILD